MDEPAAPYRYTNLTAALADPRCPLRRYLSSTFHDVRPLQAEYRAQAGTLLVEGGTAAAGTVGAAFDFLVRLTLRPDHVPMVALQAFQHSAAHVAAIRGVLDLARASAERSDSSVPTPVLVRASWVLALTTEVYRMGAMVPGSPLSQVMAAATTPEVLLGLAPSTAVDELCQLHAVARERLLPSLSRDPARLALGPTFAGSALCAADADLISAGCLLELKTRLGARHRNTGTRSDSVPLTDLYQVLAYALFDRDDAFGIEQVGFYSARYGTVVTWPLAETLSRLAGREVRLDQERQAVWTLLGG